jgi:hypothetical protein
MIQRCTNENACNWKRYGGRGIIIHREWIDSFEAFLEYVGPRPSMAYSIDRFPDRDGNYEPGNVRWATAKQQARNSSACKLTQADADFIRHWCASGFKVKAVAAAFDISSATVSDIKANRRWI